MFNTFSDVGLIGEYLYDQRGKDAPVTPFDDDLFLGARVALNNAASTEFLAGSIIDMHNHSVLYSLEASRRFGDNWLASLEARVFPNRPSTEFFHSFRNDDFVQFELSYYF